MLLACLALGACAAPGGTGPVGDRPAPVEDGTPSDSVIVGADDDSPEGLALAEAEMAWVDGRFVEAAGITDSLTGAWTRRPGLGERPVRRLVRLLLARAEDPAAVDLLLYHPDALDESWREEIRAATERMSVEELEGLSRRISRDESALGIVRAELARALALSADDEAARRQARELEDAELADEDRRKVEDVLAGRIAAGTPRLRIGFVIPRTGGFMGVGDQIIEGARLAARRWERELGVPIELDVIDEMRAIDGTHVYLDAMLGGDAFRRPDPADVERADEEDRVVLQPGRVSSAAAEGLVAVIGPVRSEGLRAAARARATPGLLLLSPVASEDSALAPHAYSLWERARRDSLEASTLANWMASEFETSRVGALHPDHESGRDRARVFRQISEAAGFEWVGSEAYAPDSTTYEEQIRALTEADPDIVYTIADGPRQVLQLAPQLHFFGLRGRIMLVNQDWTHPLVLRRLDEPFAEYRVAAVSFDRQENPEWRAFAAAWDEEYRRSVPENAFAALGYDAVTLVVRSVPDPALARPAAVARAFTRLRDVQGVTGRFSFDPELRRPVRATTVRMILNSELVPPDPRAIVDWSIETREQEEQRLEREAAEEARKEQRFP